MTTYISLLRYTAQGISHIRQSPARALAARAVAEAAGIKVLGQYWTAGEYDGVLVLQAEQEAQVLHFLTELAAAGNVRPCSLRAFDADEFAAIVGT